MTHHRVSPEEWKAGLFESFDKVRTHTNPYEICVGKFEIVVLPNVFSPKYFTDSLYFAEQLSDIVGKTSLLEIGTGTGIAALYCAVAGARVTATDINPTAVRNAKLNAARFCVDIDIRHGSLYDPIRGHEKFDYIFWNHPFNNWDEPVDMLMRAGIDRSYDGLLQYVYGARHHLTEGGQLLLGTSDMAQTEAIKEIAKECGHRLTLLRSADMPIEEGHEVWNTYFIYRFDPL